MRSVELTVNDGQLTSTPTTRQVVVSVTNDEPHAAADSYSMGQGGTFAVTAADGLLQNDSDVDSSDVAAVVVSGVQHGTPHVNTDGSFTYRPDVHFHGQDVFTYQTSDGQLSSQTVSPDYSPMLGDGKHSPKGWRCRRREELISGAKR
jgi:hypothetical protein